MWRFIEHHVMRPALWTWTQFDGSGDCARRSPMTFTTFRKAFRNAMSHGFNPRLERSEIVESRVRREPRLRPGHPQPAGQRPEARGGGV